MNRLGTIRLKRVHLGMAAAAGLVVAVGIVAIASAQHAAAPANPGKFDPAAKLTSVGAGLSAAQIDAAAAATMGGVASSNTLSSWPKTAIDQRMASVSIGQKYPAGSAAPYGATTVIAAPNLVGACDAVAVHVLPSPLSCDQVRANMAARSNLIGDLAGVPVMQDGNIETLLVPTGANTCVLVGVRTAFSK